MSSVITERSGRTVLVTINRPEAFNALNAEVLHALKSAVADAHLDPHVRAVVITGSGEKAFSAGADLQEIAAMGPDQAHEAMSHGQGVFRFIEQTPIPVIAAVNGLALGGGFELALASSFPILSTRAALGLPEASLGLIPGYGGTQRLPRALGSRVAAHLMLTGTRLSPERAFDLGLTPVPAVEPSELLDTSLALAEAIASQGPRAVRAILQGIEASRDVGIDAGLRLETGLAALAVAGAESSEGINAFLEKRDRDFDDLEEQ